MLRKRLIFSLIGLVSTVAPSGPAGPAGAAPLGRPATPPRYLATALRPTALLVRDGVALIADERNLLQRVRLDATGAAGAAESVWSPAIYPPRLLDGGGGTVIVADQRGEVIKRITAERNPWAEDLAGGQQVRTLARDATHLYWINLGAPHLRRVPLRPLNLDVSRPVPPPPPPPVEAVAALPEELVDLAVDAGELFVANATARSLQRLRRQSRPETVMTFATPPTALHLTPDAVFVGSRGGTVYRVERRDGSVRELAQVRGDVSALALAGCYLLVGSSAELVAVEAARGIAVPLAADASVSAVTAAGARVLYADYKNSGLYDVALPPCPGPEVRGSARPVQAAPSPPPAPAAEPGDSDPLAGQSSAAVHTVQIQFATTSDELARQQVRSRVEHILAEVAFELWARATPTQVAALRQDGFLVAYRDGVDRIRCTDVRKNPAAARRPPPPPFSESGSPRAYLVQLNVPSHALPDLQNELAARGVTILEAEGATLTVAASASAVARLARQRYVTWVGAYSVRERLAALALSAADGPAEACAADPDHPLRELAAWVRKQPQAELKVTAILFNPSAAFAALVRREGGRIESRDEQTFTLTIRRGALPAIAAHPDVRVLEPYAEAGLID